MPYGRWFSKDWTRTASSAPNGTGASEPSLLAGLLHDAGGHRMTPTHAVKGGRRYRYYVSQPLITQGRSAVQTGWRIPAGDIEQLVGERLCGFLANEADVHKAIEQSVSEGVEQQRLIIRARELAASWSGLSPTERRAWHRALIVRIDVGSDRIDVNVDPSRLADLLARDQIELSTLIEPTSQQRRHLTLSIHARLKRAGLGTKMIIDGARAADPDVNLVRLLVKAEQIRGKVFSGDGCSIAELAKREGISDSYVTRQLRLAFLGPDIVKAILDGRHPPTLTAAKLMRDTRLPLAWTDQRTALGFGR